MENVLISLFHSLLFTKRLMMTVAIIVIQYTQPLRESRGKRKRCAVRLAFQWEKFFPHHETFDFQIYVDSLGGSETARYLTTSMNDSYPTKSRSKKSQLLLPSSRKLQNGTIFPYLGIKR